MFYNILLFNRLFIRVYKSLYHLKGLLLFMIYVIGEILIDKFINGNDVETFPGGAPFNVACNIASFKGNVSFLGSIGHDENGIFLKKYVRKKSYSGFVLSSLKKRDTTIAEVSLKDGERSFRFIRDNGADYVLSMSKVNKLEINNGDIVHIGSLMLSESRGRRTFYKIIKIAKEKGAKISFDVNYRDDIFESASAAKRIFKKAIKECDYIKFSDEELAILTNKKRVESALKALLNEKQIAFVSLGKKGSLVYQDGIKEIVPTVVVSPIDTTGAGDAFYSYVLFSLDNKNFDYKNILRKANYVGAMATQKKGAIDVVPTIEQINQF